MANYPQGASARKSKRQINRYIEQGDFPKPVTTGGKAEFLLADVLRWHEGQHKAEHDALIEAARKPEHAAEALVNLAARLYSEPAGRELQPSDIGGVLIKATPEQLAAEQQRAASAAQESLQKFVAAFAALDQPRAWLVIAGLMPPLRATAIKVLEGSGPAVGMSDAELQALAIDILEQALTGEFVGPGSAIPV